MEFKKAFADALIELRKDKKRKFNQSVDLIINLQKFDVKRESLNILVNLPHKIKDKKICAFLESKNKGIETITRNDFKKYAEKNQIKKLIKSFDFFIAEAGLMPSVASAFGRILGPAGKMPSPHLGILTSVDDKSIEETIEKINCSVRIKTKEPSLKISVGKENMNNKDIIENIMTIYNVIIKALPRNKENVKNMQLKFTMTKPVKIAVK